MSSREDDKTLTPSRGIAADSSKQKGVYIYVSPSLRELVEKHNHGQSKQKLDRTEALFPIISTDQPWQVVDKFRYEINRMERADSETVDIVIFNSERAYKLFKVANLGFSYEAVQDAQGRRVLLVTEIRPGSPASVRLDSSKH